MNIRQYTTLAEGHSREKLIQFFIVTDGVLKIAKYNPGIFTVTKSITSQLE